MKHKPILFSTEMVQAILEGRKNMTRRTKGLEVLNEKKGKAVFGFGLIGYELNDEIFKIEAPYSIGDILWVRESFASSPFDDNVFVYKADAFESINTPNKHKWRPSIHMPKSACRIFFRVTDVRCERLQDITEQDAVDEGVKKIADYGTTGYKLYTDPDAAYSDIDAVYSFESLWAKINGQQSWDDNPWVWVVSFERCDRPEGFI